MAKLKGKVAIVTGGASGIGKGIVELFQKEGATVIAADINESSLEKISELENVHGMKLDVSSNEAWADLAKEVKATYGSIDILVNNAGFGVFGRFITTDLDREIQLINTNIMAVHILTKLFLKEMIKSSLFHFE